MQANKLTGELPLVMAVSKGYYAVAEVLLEAHVDPCQVHGESGVFALLVAAMCEMPGEQLAVGGVQVLLRRGVDPSRKNHRDGTFPLLLAAFGGHSQVVNALLEWRADPKDVSSYDFTFPLMLAASAGPRWMRS